MDMPMLMTNPRPDSPLSMLDEKSFASLCKYLSMYDMMQMGEVDIIYQRIIGEHIVAKQTFNITVLSPNYEVRHAFKYYGEFVQALNIHESDIQYKNERYTFAEEIFRLVRKRCNADRLKTVSICFDSKDWSKKGYNATNFLDVFAQVESITFSKPTAADRYSNRDTELDGFLQKLLVHCTKLRSLKLVNLSGEFGFLALKQLQNLESLEMQRCNILYDNWKKFFGADVGGRAHLKSLCLPRSGLYTFKAELNRFLVAEVHQDDFLRPIATACPNLESLCLTFGMIKFESENCSAIENLPNLRELVLTNDKYPQLIEKLVVHAKIEKLSASIAGLGATMSSGIERLINLRSIEFSEVYPVSYDICVAFARLPQVEEIVLKNLNVTTYEDFRRLILQIVEHSPRLRVLRLFVPHLILNASVYIQLVNFRRNRPTNPLQLYASFSNIPLHLYAPNVVTIYKKQRN